MSEPDEGTLHEICWNVLLREPEKPIGWLVLQVANETAAACLGHPVARVVSSHASVSLRPLVDSDRPVC